MAYKELKPQDWLDEIDNGLEYRRKFGLEDMWGTFEAIYYNVHESMLNDGPNIFLSQGDAMLSTVTVPNAKIKVSPVKPEEVDKAPLVETMDNILLREMNIAEEVDTVALHAYLFGRGFLKFGYDSEWGYDPELDLGGTLRLGLTLSQLNDSGSRRIEYDSTITPGSPWARAVLPHDIVVPWGAKELDSTPWIAHRIVRHIDDLRADKKYSVPRDLQPQLSMQDFVDSYRTVRRSKQTSNTAVGFKNEQDYVEMWEIHDRRTGKIFVVTQGCDKFLRRDDNALQIENKLPFASLSFTPRTRAFWTTPDVFYLYHIQNELSDVARQRTKQRRISTLKFLYDGDTISDEELLKILSPDVGVAAKIESGRDLTKALIKIDNTPNLALAQEEDLLRANAREQIGFSRNQLGEYTGGRKTAAEVNTVDRASQLRMSKRGLAVRRLYQDSIRVINNVVFSYWTLPRYISVLGEAQASQWMQINGPGLRGRYDYDVEFTDEADLQQRKVEALQLYANLSQDPSVDPAALRVFLTNQFNDPRFTRLFNARIPNPMQQSEVQQGGGGVQSQDAGGRGRSPVRELPRPDQEVALAGQRALVAGRGSGA